MSVKRTGTLEVVETKMMNIVSQYREYALIKSTMLRAAIEKNLESELGFAKAKHFYVAVNFNADTFSIGVFSRDEVGEYLAYGTSGHIISSSMPMPIGGGRYSYSVRHPGTTAYDDQIRRAVSSAVDQVFR